MRLENIIIPQIWVAELYKLSFNPEHQYKWNNKSHKSSNRRYAQHNHRTATVQTLSSPQTKTDNFANSVDPDEMASNKPSHLDLHCLPFCFGFWIFWWRPYFNNEPAIIQRWKSSAEKLRVEICNGSVGRRIPRDFFCFRSQWPKRLFVP